MNGLLRRIFLNEWIIIFAILGNTFTLFLMGFGQYKDINLLDRIDHIFTTFFVLEVIIKVRENGWKAYISNAGNKFDFILVAISFPSLLEIFINVPNMSYLLVFRLLRVLRVLRFMRFIPNIGQMIAGIQRAFRASAFVFGALLIYNVLLAILSTYLFHNEDPAHFGDPFKSLFTIFQIFTLEGWYEIPEAIAANSEPGSIKPAFASFFFLMVVLTGGIFGFSIVNAIFVDEMVMDNNDALEAKVDELNTKMDRLLEERGDNG